MRRSGNKLPVPFLADSGCLAWMSGPLTTILIVTDYDDLDMFGGLDASSLPLYDRYIEVLSALEKEVLSQGRTSDAAAVRTKRADVVTAAGTSLPVVSDGTTVTIGGATVVQADIKADNGIIHAIDTVLLPAMSRHWAAG